jgi:DNA-binding response OmpR family regulator
MATLTLMPRPSGLYSSVMVTRRILVVDDEPGMLSLVSLYLRQAGYTVASAATGADAVHEVELGGVDLVVLDIGLPDIDGYSVCQRIRRAGIIPVIMLTARSDHRDRIMGFELGADDYVSKPFNPEELVARVQAVLRRVQPEQDKPQRLALNGLVVDLLQRTVTADGRNIELRPKEFDLLVKLASHPGQVFTREQLLQHVWGYESLGNSATVDVHVLRLRRKLGDSAHQGRWIRTVWGAGYRFDTNQHGA